MQKVIQNRIYHYCKLTTGIEQILSFKRLLLADIKKTNDPREYKSFVFAANCMKKEDKPDSLDLSNKEISDYLRQDCKVLCFTKDSLKLKKLGYENLSMWAHYGDNHKGLCLEFDMSKFIKENKDVINQKLFKSIKYEAFNSKKFNNHISIDYTKKNKFGKEKYLKGRFRKKYMNYLYFTKAKEWEHENEIRLLHFSSNKEKEYVSIKNSLKGIYFGVDFDEHYLPAINELTKGIYKYTLTYIEGRMNPNLIEETAVNTSYAQ